MTILLLNCCCACRVPAGGPLCFPNNIPYVSSLHSSPQLTPPPTSTFQAEQPLSVFLFLIFYLAQTHSQGLGRGQDQPLPLFYSSIINTESERARQREEERERGRSIAALSRAPLCLSTHSGADANSHTNTLPSQLHAQSHTYRTHAHTTTSTTAVAATTSTTHSDGCQAQWEASRQGVSLRRKRRREESWRGHLVDQKGFSSVWVHVWITPSASSSARGVFTTAFSFCSSSTPGFSSIYLSIPGA